MQKEELHTQYLLGNPSTNKWEKLQDISKYKERQITLSLKLTLGETLKKKLYFFSVFFSLTLKKL